MATMYVLESTAPADGPIEGTNEAQMQDRVDRIADELNQSWEQRRGDLDAMIIAARGRLRAPTDVPRPPQPDDLIPYTGQPPVEPASSKA